MVKQENRHLLWFGLFCAIAHFVGPCQSIDMGGILHVEFDIIYNIRNYLSHERNHLDTLRLHLLNWKTWRNSYSSKESEYITIPQNLFHLFKKLTVDLKTLCDHLMKTDYRDTSALIRNAPLIEDDLKKVTLSLVDLQYQYNLNPQDIMNGTLMDLPLNTSLSLDSCYFIGKTCLKLNDHLCASDWLRTCFSFASNEEYRYEVAKLLYPSYIYLNQTENALKYAIKCLEYDYYDIPATDTVYELGSSLGSLNDLDNITLVGNRICRKSDYRPHPNLRCRYNHENSAFLKLAPLKEEELYLNPKLLLYQDVLYDSEIKTLKSAASSKLKVSRIQGINDTAKTKGFSFRISETAFITNRSSLLPKLMKRIQDISDLSLEMSEPWQILNYSPSGFYAAHSDYLSGNTTSIQTSGNRMTTMLFYFNTVTLGGETVFPRISVSVTPSKGSAVVWHNVLADGTVNSMTDHSACPVVIGEKWGFTQWIRSNGQKCLRKVYEHDAGISPRSQKK